jgi:hypothetical protein
MTDLFVNFGGFVTARRCNETGPGGHSFLADPGAPRGKAAQDSRSAGPGIRHAASSGSQAADPKPQVAGPNAVGQATGHRPARRSAANRRPARPRAANRRAGRRRAAIRPLPGRRLPGHKAPGHKAPGRETPGRETPGRKTPGRKTPGRKAPAPRPSGPEDRAAQKAHGPDKPAEQTGPRARLTPDQVGSGLTRGDPLHELRDGRGPQQRVLLAMSSGMRGSRGRPARKKALRVANRVSRSSGVGSSGRPRIAWKPAASNGVGRRPGGTGDVARLPGQVVGHVGVTHPPRRGVSRPGNSGGPARGARAPRRRPHRTLRRASAARPVRASSAGRGGRRCAIVSGQREALPPLAVAQAGVKETGTR